LELFTMTRDERFWMRLTADEKRLLERAAELEALSASAWARAKLITEARAVVDRLVPPKPKPKRRSR
jgi:uncharacterized protein (DUF1778 family)